MSGKPSSIDSPANARKPVKAKFVFTGNIPHCFDRMRIASTASDLQIMLNEDVILFSFGYPYAIRTGFVVYFPDVGKRPATSKAINALSPELPHVRLGPSTYDNMVATVLTKAGMVMATL